MESGGGDCLAPVATLHLVEDFFAEWQLFSPHVLPLARFLQHIGARRVSALKGMQVAPWPPHPMPKPPFVFLILNRLMLACHDITFFWGGVAFGGAASGADEGWVNRLSLDAELSLSHIRVLAVHAVNPLPDVPFTAAETTRTTVSKLEMSLAASSDDAGNVNATSIDDVLGDADVAALLLRGLSKNQLQALSDARAEIRQVYGRVTAQAAGLGVVATEARSGLCRATVEDLGLSLDAVRIFSTRKSAVNRRGDGSVIDVDSQQSLRTARDAAPHILQAFRIAEAS